MNDPQPSHTSLSFLIAFFIMFVKVSKKFFFQMKVIFLLIVAATFSQTMAELFLLELDKEIGKESQDDSDLVEHHGRREDEANEEDFYTILNRQR